MLKKRLNLRNACTLSSTSVLKTVVKKVMSKRNFVRKACLILFAVSIIFGGWSCESDKGEKVKTKLSEDICDLCSESPVHHLSDDVFIVTSKIHTPNGDGINDFFGFSIFQPNDEVFLISDKSITFYDRDNKEVVNFSQFDDCCIWYGRVNNKFVESGLYSYKLSINGQEFEGNFIIIARCTEDSNDDGYIDIDFFGNTCGKECLKHHEWLYFDPCL
jgi:gliding motility-associated-like protein